ncbi:MAG: MurR/RpiR family transcriptional regulator [Ruminococcaceae bacterium]|nr:MurR/RpiR family transcriptional regulator [Oscillospiraceae bacterium]
MSEHFTDCGCMLRIEGMRTSFKAAEARIADLILANPDQVMGLTINELAKISKTSYATVTRFCKKLGYEGYKDFKTSFMRSTLSGQNRSVLLTDLRIDLSCSVEEICNNLFAFFQQSLEESRSMLDASLLDRAAEIMHSANSVFFVGTGTSSLCAQYACSRFFRIGLNCGFESDATLYRMRVSTLKKGDVLFAISASGRSSDIVNCARIARENGAYVISLSDFSGTPLTNHADISLFTTPRTAKLSQNIDMPLFTCQIMLIDTLTACCCAKNPQRAADVYARTRVSSTEEKMTL